MAKNLDDIFVEEDDLTPEQQRLLLWRDYFDFLLTGMAFGPGGSEDEPWTEKQTEVITYLKVMKNECESDVMHLEGEQERFCRWGDAKDLTEYAINE
jgi:hypothetical protein